MLYAIRKLNLLGKDAVNLLSASAKSGRKRGGGAVSSQGFVNYFNVPSLAEDGGTFSQSPSQPRGQQDGLEGAGGKPSTADKPRADDLLARLRGTDGHLEKLLRMDKIYLIWMMCWD